MPLFEMSWFTVALIVIMIPWLCVRANRMGLVGMWVPQACPPAGLRYDPKATKCCEHNQCPDRPDAASRFKTQPWRCPQCRQWWVSEPIENPHASTYWAWKKVSASAGDGFIE